jgi:hypothetical protein
MTFAPVTRDLDTQPFTVAIVQALLADAAVTGSTAENGYEGVGTRVYPEVNIDPDPSGKGAQFPYLIVVAPASSALVDFTGVYMNGLWDITVVDRGHTPTNARGGTQNVVPVAAAAFARLVNNPLTVSGYGGITVSPEVAPRGTAIVQSGSVIRQRMCTVRIQATKL